MVCGDAADAAGALAGNTETKPHVVQVDISLAGSTGLDLKKAIRAEDVNLPLLVVSMHD
jgi:DNA-binding NarL/FixJ family response regulator